MVLGRRWESWVVYERAGAKVGERFLRRHFTAKAAFEFANDISSDPKLLEGMIDAMIAGERVVFVHPDVRPAGSTPKGEPGRTGRAGEFGATGRR